ncbi:ribosomal maturation YjgA family protein [Chitinophaga rhizophila]|uniref:DUF2809 domain-containing protein n=1 Tax=Chitinophaga rhizophila TaxID=2866212 RepID=A0ABS7GC21_9BACT|nr:DUF2809 domain-containing protein [Chitinophaga rhizophila]MBW8684359.1 DUF2809 domain-containing protein [Chitinophaga rhizophila]
MKLRFNWIYFALTVFIFLIEVLIALYVHDDIIRPYVGDILVVILIYCFVRSFLQAPVLPVAVGVLVFSCTIEIMQYFKLVTLLGLDHSRLARIAIGNYFSWGDMICYVLGIGLTMFIEKIKPARFHQYTS